MPSGIAALLVATEPLWIAILTEWELTQAKYAQIVAAARTRYAAGL